MVSRLEEQIEEVKSFCSEHGYDLEEITASEEFEIIGAIDDLTDTMVKDEDTKKEFLTHARNIRNLYEAILPMPEVEQYESCYRLLKMVAKNIRSLNEPADVSDLEDEMQDILDDAVDVEPYELREKRDGYGDHFDLSEVDFDRLKEWFESATHKNTKAEKLRNMLERKVQTMVRKNKEREYLLDRFEQMMEEYNAGSKNVEKHYRELLAFHRDLTEEEKRHMEENLTEEELAIFDILTRPEPELTPDEEDEVKKVAKDLLETLKDEKLVLDWKKRQQTDADVKVTIRDKLIDLPEDEYPKDVYEEKCRRIYQHIYENYDGDGDNIYNRAG